MLGFVKKIIKLHLLVIGLMSLMWFIKKTLLMLSKKNKLDNQAIGREMR
jgi:uncharacterized membrane protein (Fun14 family)